MGASRRAALLVDLARLEGLKTTAETAYENGLTEIESYRFDSGEGSQQTKYRSLDELQKTLDWINSRIDSMNRRLNGSGLVNINLRRKHYSGTFHSR